MPQMRDTPDRAALAADGLLLDAPVSAAILSQRQRLATNRVQGVGFIVLAKASGGLIATDDDAQVLDLDADALAGLDAGASVCLPGLVRARLAGKVARVCG